MIEQDIDKLLVGFARFIRPIAMFEWIDREGLKLSPMPISEMLDHMIDGHEGKSVWTKVDKIIEDSTLEECLTSPSEYIRECKKWFENKENRECKIRKRSRSKRKSTS